MKNPSLICESEMRGRKLVAIFWFSCLNWYSQEHKTTKRMERIISSSVKCLKNYSQIDIKLNGCGNVLSLNFNILIAALGTSTPFSHFSSTGGLSCGDIVKYEIQ